MERDKKGWMPGSSRCLVGVGHHLSRVRAGIRDRQTQCMRLTMALVCSPCPPLALWPLPALGQHPHPRCPRRAGCPPGTPWRSPRQSEACSPTPPAITQGSCSLGSCTEHGQSPPATAPHPGTPTCLTQPEHPQQGTAFTQENGHNDRGIPCEFSAWKDGSTCPRSSQETQ